MPITFSNAGSLNGTTPVMLQARPTVGALIIRELYINNCDTAGVVLSLYITGGYNIWKGSLDIGDTLMLSQNDIIILNTSTDIFAKLDGAPATTNPTYVIGMAYDEQTS